ncbi:NfeD family protein [Inmirania thermothiophila]|uniref:Membrane-bound serine protease (ClpP class) n=1 Tax=Inmirania thermothiophila TaxID=1750597 RepID=A0A3N1Y1M8_9GAMM|nr:nodulation protein NfeD [Inmirania thermothiophila]ROR32734.1 membrane-bound serine protease (ClpP class) [Inmirania thermothiophila]
MGAHRSIHRAGVLLPTLLLLLSCAGAAPRGAAHLLTIAGAIGPATADYVVRGIEGAAAAGAEVVILRMDTPGGLDGAMRDIIRAILASPVPVVTWVAPSGARAASAGTYILYASHVAAMAPATNLGAATPVQIGGLPAPTGPERGPERPGPAPEGTPSGETGGEAPADPMKHKIVNDAVAYIRALAELRGRNAEWAEKAVREAASLSAQAALEAGVIDLMAGVLPALLEAIDGRTVRTAAGERRLATRGLAVVEVEPDWRARLLAVITDPNVAYILMLLGIYGLFFELANPGFVVPGVVGAISLLLALFAFQVLPVNYAGLALVLLGIAFMVAEAFMPSFGALGIGGVIAFVAGSVLLMDRDVEGFGIAWQLIAGVGATTAVLFMVVVGMAVRARRRPVVSGAEELLGATAEAVEDFEGTGRVRLHGELWQAESPVPVRRGQRLRVTAVEGLRVRVAPLGEGDETAEEAT